MCSEGVAVFRWGSLDYCTARLVAWVALRSWEPKQASETGAVCNCCDVGNKVEGEGRSPDEFPCLRTCFHSHQIFKILAEKSVGVGRKKYGANHRESPTAT